VFEEIDEQYSLVDGAYDHYARAIQTALDGYADCVLATDPSPEESDTYAGVLETRATAKPRSNDEQFRRALDDLEERYAESANGPKSLDDGSAEMMSHFLYIGANRKGNPRRSRLGLWGNV
jgi:hypothetical protein